ncbi:hypothetical protein ACLMJK_007348 [Lecanora helva]
MFLSFLLLIVGFSLISASPVLPSSTLYLPSLSTSLKLPTSLPASIVDRVIELLQKNKDNATPTTAAAPSTATTTIDPLDVALSQALLSPYTPPPTSTPHVSFPRAKVSYASVPNPNIVPAPAPTLSVIYNRESPTTISAILSYSIDTANVPPLTIPIIGPYRVSSPSFLIRSSTRVLSTAASSVTAPASLSPGVPPSVTPLYANVTHFSALSDAIPAAGMPQFTAPTAGTACALPRPSLANGSIPTTLLTQIAPPPPTSIPGVPTFEISSLLDNVTAAAQILSILASNLGSSPDVDDGALVADSLLVSSLLGFVAGVFGPPFFGDGSSQGEAAPTMGNGGGNAKGGTLAGNVHDAKIAVETILGVLEGEREMGVDVVSGDADGGMQLVFMLGGLVRGLLGA